MRPDPNRSDRRLPPVLLGILFVGALTLISSCGGDEDSYTNVLGTQVTDVDLSGTDVEMHHSIGCQCCHEWAAYMRDHGATVVPIAHPDLDRLRDEHGIPVEAVSCHVAFIEGYVVEGHVPAETIAGLLVARPLANGLDQIADAVPLWAARRRTSALWSLREERKEQEEREEPEIGMILEP